MDRPTQHQFLQWYQENKRPLPWRESRDPYEIWISEVMLQQTTVKAVVPYYERFLARFPDLKSLARATQAEVFAVWAGLGYYSRAKNLHTSSKALVKLGHFPKTYGELLKFPGFGPYTARAVASLAHGESVGVLDGNVIRVLARYYALKASWWKPKVREDLQGKIDSWVKDVPSHLMNQAAMELGATICTPKNPACMLCPLQKSCGAFARGLVSKLPISKPRKASEIWSYRPQVFLQDGRMFLIKRKDLSFLRNHWVLPGPAQRLSSPPKKFDFRHGITHHDIFIKLDRQTRNPSSLGADKGRWVRLKDIPKVSPTSLLAKTLKHLEKT